MVAHLEALGTLVGAVATALNVAMLRSWGFTVRDITSEILVTGTWSQLTKYVLLAITLALLALLLLRDLKAESRGHGLAEDVSQLRSQVASLQQLLTPPDACHAICG